MVVAMRLDLAYNCLRWEIRHGSPRDTMGHPAKIHNYHVVLKPFEEGEVKETYVVLRASMAWVNFCLTQTILLLTE